MAQRFTLDRQSFEQFLAAASLVQQFQKQAVGSGGRDTFAQPLLELVDTQKAIDSGRMDVDSAIERIVRLTLRVVGGEGTAVWLFSNDEFVYRAGSGRNASQDERLRLTVLARVAAICEPSRESFPGQREWAKGAGDSGYFPGAVRSLIVGPIYQNGTVVGALAGFSSDFNAFDQRDAGNIRLLSGLIGNAMEHSRVAQTQSVVALPRQQVLRLIEQIVPTLQKLIRKEESAPTTLPQVAESQVQEDQHLEPLVGQALPAPIMTETAEEPTPHIEPAPDRQPAISLGEVGLETAIEQPSLDREQPADVLNTAALTDELARVSRNIAEIEATEQVANLSGPVAASSETIAGDEAPMIQAENQQPTPLADVPVLLKDNTEVFGESEVAGQTFSIDDTSVPGIGVRAALYDDEEPEPSRFWPAIRQGVATTARFFSRSFARMMHGLEKMGASLTHRGRTLAQQSRRASAYRPEFPKLPTYKVKNAYREAQSSLTSAARRARGQLSSLAKHKAKFPTLPNEILGPRVKTASGSLRRIVGAAVTRVNSFVNSLPDLPRLLSAPATPQMKEAESSATESLKEASARPNKIQRYRLRVRLNGRALQRSASAFAILVVMSAFLIMESGLFRSDTTAAASARENEGKNSPVANQTADKTSTRDSSLAIASPQRAAAAHSTSAYTGPTSHRTITDPGTADIVQNLTRYEVSTLRRQAESGDEEAAFQLGMAYETGYDLSQNCTKAAEWVTRAAENGYPAAEYNLGLRYRDGDGVAANPTDSEKWLSKAAARKYHPARAALAALTSQEKPTGK